MKKKPSPRTYLKNLHARRGTGRSEPVEPPPSKPGQSALASLVDLLIGRVPEQERRAIINAEPRATPLDPFIRSFFQDEERFKKFRSGVHDVGRFLLLLGAGGRQLLADDVARGDESWVRKAAIAAPIAQRNFAKFEKAVADAGGKEAFLAQFPPDASFQDITREVLSRPD